MTGDWFRVDRPRPRHPQEYVRSGASPAVASPVGRLSNPALTFLVLLLGARGLVFAESWTNIGPYSGYINSLAIDPRDHNVLYCGTYGANAFKTTDGGVTWRPAREGLQSELDEVGCLAINPLSPDEVYAGLDVYYVPLPAIRKSTDGGLHWKPASPRIPPGSWVMALACDPTRDGTVYAGSFGEPLYITRDGGDTWTAAVADGQLRTVADISVDRKIPGLVFAAAARAGIYRSTDWGRSWEPVNQGLGEDLFAEEVEISPTDGHTVYAISYGRLYVSTDTGGTWSRLNVPYEGSISRVLKVWTQVAGNPAPGRPMLVTTAGRYVYISYDEAETWVNADYGLEGIGEPNSSNYVLDLASPPGMPWIMYAGTVWGLYKSVDGGKEWRESHYGITNVNISHAAFAIDPDRPGWLATPAARENELGSQSKIMVTPDGGVTWWQSMAGIADQYYGDFVSTVRADLPGSPIHAAMNDQGPVSGPGVYRSDDDARTWSLVFRLRTGQSYIRFFQMDPVSAETLYLGVELVEHGIDVTVIYRSTDGGQSWLRLSTIKETVFCMAIDRTNPSVLYAGPYRPRVYKSVDGGESWRVLSTTGLPDSWFQVGDILVDPQLSSLVYANTYPQGLFRSTDAGQSWKRIGAGVVYSVSIVALAIDPTDSRVVYAGVDQKPYLYKSEDRGITWRPIGKGLQGGYVGSILINPRDPRNIYVGTSGSGIFVTTTGRE